MLTLTLNRPDKKNALTRAMYQALGDAIDGAAADTGVRCILFQAEGNVFTAGNDLGDFAAANRGEPRRAPRRRQPAARRAGARDHAAGGGGERAARSASGARDAAALRPGVRVGRRRADDAVREPGANPGGRLQPRRCRRGSATRGPSRCSCWEKRWTPERPSSGASPTLCARGRRCAERARAAADAVAAQPASAVRLTKALMRDPAALAARMEIEGRHFAAQLTSPEAREAFAAFAEKRAPDFSRVSRAT